MSHPNLERIPQAVADWKKYLAFFAKPESQSKFTHGEQKCIDALTDFLKYEDFNGAKKDSLIGSTGLRQYFPFHKNNTLGEMLGEFSRLCVDFMFTDAEVFKEFQKQIFGGKKKRTAPKPDPVKPPVPPVPPKPDTVPDDKNRNNKKITVIAWENGLYTGEVNARQEPHGNGSWSNTAHTEEKNGTWRNGQLHGSNCRHKNESGRVDTGEFTDGNRTGTGKMVWTNGAWYTGEWNSNGRHGTGEEHLPSGNWGTGFWQNDKLVGTIILRLTDGTTEEGYWDDNSQWQKKSAFGDTVTGRGWTKIVIWIAAGLAVVATVWSLLSDGLWSAIGTAFTGAIYCGVLYLILRCIKWLLKNKLVLCLVIVGIATWFVYNSYHSSDGWLNGMFNSEKTAAVETDTGAPVITGRRTATVTADKLGLRAEPKKNATSLKTLNKGETVTVTGIASDGWIPVESDGKSGYVMEQYLRINDKQPE